MPELPDVEAYLRVLQKEILGKTIQRVRLRSIFLVRTFEPPFDCIEGRTVVDLSRLGKRLVFKLSQPDRGTAQSEETERSGPDHVWMVLHLMISGRLRWQKPGAGLPGKMGLCAFDFDHGTLILTEASKKKRASIHLVESAEALAAHDPGGLELADIDRATFEDVLTKTNHTLKRALTDPRILSGIGGAYADEIMHRARLSPLKWTSRLTPEEMDILYDSCREVLQEWTGILIRRAGPGWPNISAFQEGMAVHGRFGKPCPVCGNAVQRIVYASNETNYCPSCQTGGKLLADRSLSRLLKSDWPKTIEELEELRGDPPRTNRRD